MQKNLNLRTVSFPKNHELDFETKLVTDLYTINIRMRWNIVSEQWFLNIKDRKNQDVGIPIALIQNQPIFTTDEKHGVLRFTSPRPQEMPEKVGFILICDTKVTKDSFRNNTAQLALLEEI